MNSKGGLISASEGMILLFFAMILFYVWIVMFQAIMPTGVFPVLSNAQTFPQGSIAITLLQFWPIIIIVALFIAFFNHVRASDRPQQEYGY